jgi:DNA primase
MGAVDEVKQRLNIVEVISSYMPLNKAGRNYKGLCPFHNEKTPSFIVFPDTQHWHCFGACGTGGDVITFVMKRENMEFGDALKMLAARAGVELAPPTQEQVQQADEQKRIWEMNRLAAEYWQRLLMESDEAARALAYVQKRGLTHETLRSFQIGYARDTWQALGDYLKTKGFRDNDLLAAGLSTERENGGTYDRFRGRIIYPIRDVRGHISGFGGRVLDDSQPKYLNSPQTPVFDKGSVLYGIDLAREAIRRSETAVLVEGYMDALMAHQGGFNNVVAAMGTALSPEQLGVLKPLARRLILALDPDAAGDKATLRGLDVAKETMDTRVVPVPTPRGYIRYERELDAELRILSLPEGKDPDEVIHEDPARWEQLIAAALPIMDYYFKALTAGLDLNKAKDKSAAVQALLPLIGELPDGVERAHYVQRLAGMVRTDERVLAQELERNSPRRRRTAALVESPTSELDLESYALYLIGVFPELAAAAQEWRDDLFVQAQNAAVFAQILAAGGPESLWAQPEFMAQFDDVMSEHVQSLVQQYSRRPAVLREEAPEALATVARRLRREHLRERDRDLQALIQAAVEDGDSEAIVRYAAAVNEVSARLRSLAEEEKARTLVGRRSGTGAG